MAKLLLLEDDLEVGDLYAGFLGEYEVWRASSAKEALAHLNGNVTFDAAIIDFWLVEGTAIPVLDAIKSNSPDLPVILISGGNQSFSPELTEAFGSISQHNVFLHKPVQRSHLLTALNTALANKPNN